MFDWIFRTVFWKITALLLLFVLFVVAGNFFLETYFALFESVQHTNFTAGTNASSFFQWGVVSLVLLGMILLAGVLDLTSSFYLAHQYRLIAATVENFAAGKLDLRVKAEALARNREIRALAQAFNSMADTIAANLKELENTDRMRREMIANIAHDLGTPVTSIQGYVETILLKHQHLDQKERETFLNVILGNTKALSKLVGELFDVTKLEAKELIPQFEAFSIVTLSEDVASRFIPIADKKGVRIIVERNETLPLVFADINLIERALTNIVENAVQYTASNDSITISFAALTGYVEIAVTDTGVGIPKSDLPYIFDRFYRVSKDRSRTTGGAGLGLAIAKNILAVHGRTIEVHSEEGKGSRFSFSLTTGLSTS